MARNRVGIYGGTFDPVHNGHINVARGIIDAFGFDELLFVPAFVPPHKREQMISAGFHRFAMLVIATESEPEMRVSTIELELPSKPYTVETLARLQANDPQSQLFFVMGADSFAEITSWREYERLLMSYSIVVAVRPQNSGHWSVDTGQGQESAIAEDESDPGSHLPSHLRERIVDLRGARCPSRGELDEQHIFLTDYVLSDVAATRIRELIRSGCDASALLPRGVDDYAIKYGIYDLRA